MSINSLWYIFNVLTEQIDDVSKRNVQSCQYLPNPTFYYKQVQSCDRWHIKLRKQQKINLLFKQGFFCWFIFTDRFETQQGSNL